MSDILKTAIVVNLRFEVEWKVSKLVHFNFGGQGKQSWGQTIRGVQSPLAMHCIVGKILTGSQNIIGHMSNTFSTFGDNFCSFVVQLLHQH